MRGFSWLVVARLADRVAAGPRGGALRGLLAARHVDGLAQVRLALGLGGGVAGAARALGVSVETLTRRSWAWPELRAVLLEGRMSLEERGRVGGAARSEQARRVAGSRAGG
jgi:hypothetical protein